MTAFVIILLAAFFGFLTLAVLYLVVLTISSVIGRRRPYPTSAPLTRFAVLIPAHDEEAVLSETLKSLQRLQYPPDLFEIHLVADNCSDKTVETARSFVGSVNLTIHERYDDTKRGKGYAIEWLLNRLQGERDFDAYVMLDADWTVSANLLDVMNARLRSGVDIVQVWCRATEPSESWVTGLRCIALALVNYVRPLGLDTLGFSCGLKGTGMGFASRVLREIGWLSFSLAEDSEQHIKLVLAGRRAVFAPEAYLESRMPPTLKTAYSQNLRWESGKIALLSEYALELVKATFHTRRPAPLRELFGLLVPPLSLLIALCVGALGLALLLGFKAFAIVAVALIAGIIVHVATGLLLIRPPRAVYFSLLFAPLFILWKLRVYLAALRERGRGPWVRTTRPGEALQ